VPIFCQDNKNKATQNLSFQSLLFRHQINNSSQSKKRKSQTQATSNKQQATSNKEK
jgi:hypothetical protein